MKKILEKVQNMQWDGKWVFRTLFFVLSILWMEGVVKVWCLGTLWDRGLWYMLLFTLPLGGACGLLCSPWNEKVNCCIAFLLQTLMTVWFGTQAVYYTIFRSFLVLDSLSMAQGALTDFWRNAVDGIISSLLPMFLVLLPLIVLILRECYKNKRGRYMVRTAGGWPAVKWKTALIMLVVVALLQGGAVLAVRSDDEGMLSASALYGQAWTPDLSVANFGIMTTLRLEAQFMMGWGGDSEDDEYSGDESGEDDPDFQPIISDGPGASSGEVTPGGTSSEVVPGGSTEAPSVGGGEVTPVDPGPAPVVYEANVLDIDFESLIANESNKTLKGMHQYFSTREPTMQNEYTGMFEGKNLIFITAEGFWKYAVNETYTPTLWKLANEGFVFENFYNPLWWKSTTDGEYVACTSLVPSSKVRSFKQSANNSMVFCMGNMLSAEGYTTKAYHNHTYTYYNRNVSHPNMGYEYYGLGNGLEVKKSWPESDLEMMQKTIPQALEGEMPFHNYYMTVSGHMNYNFLGNSMAAKHKAEVADLDMSEEAKAYIACNMEFDQAMAYVLEQLEAAGQLENTVICISGDHYPYGMDPNTWNEFYGGEMDTEFEVYRSSLIIWSGDMEEPIVVDKPCGSLDILPTLLNLFGLEYDSRLLAGSDILSDSPGLVFFKNRSFITEEGRYNSSTNTWIPNEGSTVQQGYATEVYNHVKDLFNYSVKILDNDYYGVLGLEDVIQTASSSNGDAVAAEKPTVEAAPAASAGDT